MDTGGEGTEREGSAQGVGLEWKRGVVRQGNEGEHSRLVDSAGRGSGQAWVHREY